MDGSVIGSACGDCVASEVVRAEELPTHHWSVEPEHFAFEAVDDGDDHINMGLTCRNFIQISLERVHHELRPVNQKLVDSIGHDQSFIASVTSPFCGDCNRLRVNFDGKACNSLF